MIAETRVLVEIAEIFFVATIAGLALNKLKQPVILAYILTGLLLGPQVLGLVKEYELISFLSEIGVIALLFTLGLEFSFDKFKQVRRVALFAGSLQILLTIFIVAILSKLIGFNLAQSILLGSIVALSSTVIVLKSLTESAQLDSLHGRIIMGILIIQDLSLIPIMIILPNLGFESAIMFKLLGIAVLKATVFLGLAIFLSLKVAPKFMNLVASVSREVLMLFSIAVAIGMALIASYFGISLALGAFIAGLALSVTAHSRQVIAEVVPFRDVFAMVFFVSIGMLMDIGYFLDNFGLISLVVLTIFIVKFLICFGIVFLAKYPGKTALWTGLSLFQIGEFSFVLAKVGVSEKIISQDIYSLIIISTLITMLATPFVIRMIPDLITQLHGSSFWNRYFKGKIRPSSKTSKLTDHIIICGFGPIAKGIANILHLYCENFVVIELNNKTVHKLKKEHIPVIYGDATNVEVLEHAGIQQAKIFVVALPDFQSCEIAVSNARKLNEDIHIIVRARFQTNIENLYKAGANVVIYEEYETSIAMINNTMLSLNYPANEVESLINMVRQDRCKLLKQ